MFNLRPVSTEKLLQEKCLKNGLSLNVDDSRKKKMLPIMADLNVAPENLLKVML